MLADALGRPLRFRITAGQAHDITAAPALLEGQEADAILADKAYDGNELREMIAQMEAQAVIPSKRNRKVFIPHDTELPPSSDSGGRRLVALAIRGGCACRETTPSGDIGMQALRRRPESMFEYIIFQITPKMSPSRSVKWVFR